MPQLAQTGLKYFGGYANTFQPIPEDWDLEGDRETDGFLDLRKDLDPESYAAHASDWLKAGATVIGGCCGTRPAHIAKLKELMNAYLSVFRSIILIVIFLHYVAKLFITKARK